MHVVSGQPCERVMGRGLHCWHRTSQAAASGDHEVIVESCCWCGGEVHYRGPSLARQAHGPYFEKGTDR